MINDKWVWERAVHIAHLPKATDRETAIASTLRFAIERGKAEDLHPDDVLMLRRTFDELLAAEAALARLSNPDEALVETMGNVAERLHNDLSFKLVDAIRALARTLGKENSDG